MDHSSPSATLDADWKPLYIIGGVAAFLAVIFFRRNFGAEMWAFNGFGIYSVPEVEPVLALEWFELLQTSPFVGLAFLGLIDLVNYALVSLIFLALFAALRMTSSSGMLVTTTFALSGCSVYFISNHALDMLSLSRQFAAAGVEEAQFRLLVAGETILTSQSSGTGSYLSLLLVLIAGAISSMVMLRSSVFGKAAAISGLLANGIGLLYFVVLVIAPAINWLPPTLSAPFRMVWYVLIAVKLIKLGTRKTIQSKVPFVAEKEHPMTQAPQGDHTFTENDLHWKELYRIGAYSSLLVALLVVVAVIAFLIWPFSAGVASTEEIFMTLQNDLLGGLMSLDLLLLTIQLINILPLLALYAALKQVNESYALVALVLGLMAVILIIAARPLADLVYLSRQYSAATTDANRNLYAAAGEALLALFNGTAWMVFTVFLALSGLISSLLMLRSHFFRKSTAITGMMASAPGLLFFIPVVGTFLLFVGTVGGVVWYVLVARDFFWLEQEMISKYMPSDWDRQE